MKRTLLVVDGGQPAGHPWGGVDLDAGMAEGDRVQLGAPGCADGDEGVRQRPGEGAPGLGAGDERMAVGPSSARRAARGALAA